MAYETERETKIINFISTCIDEKSLSGEIFRSENGLIRHRDRYFAISLAEMSKTEVLKMRGFEPFD